MKLFSRLFKNKRGTGNLCPVCGKPLKAGQIYRGQNNEKCCETCWLKANPPHKAAPAPEQPSPARAPREEPAQPAKAVNPASLRTLPFTALRLPGSEREIPALPADRHAAMVRQIADRFFTGSRRALMNPSGNEEQDRYRAMERLLQFLFSTTDFAGGKMFSGYDSLITALKYEPNILKLLIHEYESSCYDGGAGGTDTVMTWMSLERPENVPPEILSQAGSREAGGQEPPVRDLYRGTLPGEDFRCVFRCCRSYGREKLSIDYNKGIFLFNPFGLEGVYCLRTYSETW